LSILQSESLSCGHPVERHRQTQFRARRLEPPCHKKAGWKRFDERGGNLFTNSLKIYKLSDAWNYMHKLLSGIWMCHQDSAKRNQALRLRFATWVLVLVLGAPQMSLRCDLLDRFVSIGFHFALQND